MSDKPTFEPSEFRNQTDFLLNLIERSQFAYVEALRLGGWPTDVILAAYESDADKSSEIYNACIDRANKLSTRDKDKQNLADFVDWVFDTVKWAIDANLGPRRTDKMTKEAFDDFIDTMTHGGFITYETLNEMYGQSKRKSTVLWAMTQVQNFLKEHDAEELTAFSMEIHAIDNKGDEKDWEGEIG